MRHLAGFFPANAYPNVLVGLGEPDDAAVYRIDESTALIATTDFFTPVVDDPWTFGAIAAVNALSDVYAMGGEALFCLNLAGFPEGTATETVIQIFAGGAAKVREAGAAITGGHTVTSPEPFYGLCVVGVAHPDRVLTKGGAQPGDRLFLTKPLGTGLITTAAKLTGPGERLIHRMMRRMQRKPNLATRHLDAAVLSMLRLNRAAAAAAVETGCKSATDITGFGLLGHACEMAGAGVGFRLRAGDMPVLPGAWMAIAAGYLTQASRRNPESFGAKVRWSDTVTPEQRTLLWEAETSGGLLVAVPDADRFRAACAVRSQACWEIGEVVAGSSIEVV